jgi:hypothetical protein
VAECAAGAGLVLLECVELHHLNGDGLSVRHPVGPASWCWGWLLSTRACESCEDGGRVLFGWTALACCCCLLQGVLLLLQFVLVTDLLLLVAVMILGVGDLAGRALYTVSVLAVIEAAVMLAEFVAWSSSLQVAHSFLVLAIVLFNVVLILRKRGDYAREIAAFLPSY